QWLPRTAAEGVLKICKPSELYVRWGGWRRDRCSSQRLGSGKRSRNGVFVDSTLRPEDVRSRRLRDGKTSLVRNPTHQPQGHNWHRGNRAGGVPPKPIVGVYLVIERIWGGTWGETFTPQTLEEWRVLFPTLSDAGLRGLM